MNIYLTRHGETQWNKEGRVQGFLDSPLTEKGIEDGQKLKERLKDVDLDLVFSSPQGRAIHTGEIIMEGHDAQLLLDEGLRELGVGDWQGLYYDDIKRCYKEDFEIYTTAAHRYIPKNGGETYQDFEKRVQSFVDKLKTLDEENILIVTHGVTYMMILNLFENKGLDQLCNRTVPGGTNLSKIRYENNQFKIEYEDCDSHHKEDKWEK